MDGPCLITGAPFCDLCRLVCHLCQENKLLSIIANDSGDNDQPDLVDNKKEVYLKSNFRTEIFSSTHLSAADNLMMES